MTTSNIHCGVTKLPKGKRLGSMKECIDLGQIRHWGRFKFDPKLLEAKQAGKTKKKNSKTRFALFEKIVSFDGKIKKLKRELDFMKKPTKEDKKRIKDEVKKLEEQKQKYTDKYKKLGF